MIIKVCGMREPENIRAIEQAGADWMGFIFFPQSARYVSHRPEYLPEQCHRIGVFVNESSENILLKAQEFGLHHIQLHGRETPEQCRKLKAAGLGVIKVFSIAQKSDLQSAGCYEGICDYFLFDTACSGYGGSGKTFNWNILQAYQGKTPFLLSGGLRPGSLSLLLQFKHEQWAGIDLNSGFETAPALKDAAAVHTFINQLKQKNTMNRINQLFSTKQKDILSIYFCAGFPTLEGTASTIKVLEKKGINMIEIGIPFSDPMADGPVIQHAATRALKNGMTLKLLFDQLKDIRKEVQIPLVLMGYLNPIMQYGFKDFCRTCRETGIDGVIIPDLPFKDYMEEYRSIAEEQDVRIIMLITPETSEERIRLIDEHTDGFIYMVSSAAITGAQKDFNAQKQAYFQRIADMNLRNPRMIGFGISNKQTFETASAHAAGAIIGSKFVTLLDEEDGDTEKAADKLLEALKN